MNAEDFYEITAVCSGGPNMTVKYAAEELGKYLEKMTGIQPGMVMQKKEGRSAGKSISIGMLEDLGLKPLGTEYGKFDDEIYIEIVEGTGVISGINPRSVLLAVYRFLSEAGCSWVRPGIDGESIPSADLKELSVKLHERPSYRHRGICIEGANSNENVLDMIEWLPKVGSNAYFIQFREAFNFYNLWYTHRLNPLKAPEDFNIERAREYVANAVREIKKRDLIYHAVGHGWTCEPLGLPGLGWDAREYDISPEVEKYLALVKGKREVWQGISLNTNLCYSNPEARNLIVNDMVNYLEGHREADILHFWLADAANNQCECENCQKAIPSDFYVQMLNQLDEILTQKGIDTKVVFLIYFDLLWAPEKERIKNPDRFILMFAPITRTYSSAFDTENPIPEPSAYVRNQLKFATNVEENLAALKSWQELFKGDSFDFDYHFMWDHFLDPGYFKIADILSKDIKNLKKIGLDGFMSCQVQRSFFPTGLGMYVMGKTLWNSGLSFAELAKEYFEASFGSDGLLCIEYLSDLSELFDPPYLRGEKPRVSQATAENFRRIPEKVEAFRSIIDRNLTGASADECRRKSWQYMKLHGDMCIIYSGMLEAIASGNEDKADSIKKELAAFVQKNEDEMQRVFDLYIFLTTLDQRLFRPVSA